MRLTKHHGLGNDFLITFAAIVPADIAELARRVCNRHRGVGADGLIVLTPGDRPGVDAVMTLLNADGSAAEISGNGLRCVAQAIASARSMDDGALVVATRAGDRSMTVRRGSVPGEVSVTVDMGVVHEGPLLARDPVAPTVVPLQAATFDIGNPHLVVLVDDPDAVDVGRAGPFLERDYPGGINVHFVSAAADNVLELRVWERGAGVTEACGSGAVVAAHAARQWGIVGDNVRVRMPGGEALVEIGVRSLLTGPSVFIATIELVDA